jgi:hypothetical protein
MLSLRPEKIAPRSPLPEHHPMSQLIWQPGGLVRFLQAVSFAVLFLFAPCTKVQAQNALQPGQLASTSLPGRSGFLAEPAALAPVQKEPVAFEPDRPSRTMNRMWLGSVAALIAATSADAATSWGHQEANGFLASNGGNFGVKGLTLKLAGTSATLIPQLVFRHHSKLLKVFAIGNAAEASMYAGLAVHNIGVTSR